MAKFMPGPAVAEVRGSIGGTVFSRNRYGAYMRFRAKPTVSTTEEATAAKARMTAGTQAFQALSVEEQRAWNMWANANPVTGALGEPQILTGHAAFVGNYAGMLARAFGVITAPPVTPAPTPLLTFSFVADKTAGTCVTTFTATPLGAFDVLSLDACYVASAGKHWVENLYRLAAVSASGLATGWDPFALIEARIGAMTIGHRLVIKATVFNASTGLKSAPLRAEDTIV